jgi:hypothetical protein
VTLLVVLARGPRTFGWLILVDDAAIEADPEMIRVKVGLEPLNRLGIEKSESGWRVRFHGPQQARYQEGIQCVFVATVPKQHLTAAGTPWVLKSARWRE